MERLNILDTRFLGIQNERSKLLDLMKEQVKKGRFPIDF